MDTKKTEKSYYAIIAGISLLIMAILAGFSNTFINGVFTINNVSKTFNKLIDSLHLFRLGILGFFFVGTLDIIAAWALFIFLKKVNKNLSFLSALFRIIYSTILFILLIIPLYILLTLKEVPIITEQIQTQIYMLLNVFKLGWDFSLILFGFHLFILAYLLFKAGYMKRLLGIILFISSFGYIIDGIGIIITETYNLSLTLFLGYGEVILLLWLLIKGRKTEEI
jgi:hypothetical protein